MKVCVDRNRKDDINGGHAKLLSDERDRCTQEYDSQYHPSGRDHLVVLF